MLAAGLVCALFHYVILRAEISDTSMCESVSCTQVIVRVIVSLPLLLLSLIIQRTAVDVGRRYGVEETFTHGFRASNDEREEEAAIG